MIIKLGERERMERRLALIPDERIKDQARIIFEQKGYEAMKTFTYCFIYGVVTDRIGRNK